MIVPFSFFKTPLVIIPNLIFHLDAGVSSSYPGSGSTWSDLSGRGNNFALFNSPTYNSGSGGYITFNGSNQYGSMTLPSNISNNKIYTVNMWVRMKTNKIGGAFWCSGTNTSTFSFIQNGGFPDVIQFNGSATTGMTTNVWYMLSGTGNGSNYTFYVNAVNKATSSATQVFSVDNYLGKRGDGIYFNCDIATIKVYDRELSASEITTEFNNTKGRFGL